MPKKTGKRANSEGTIRQRPDGRWEARMRYRDADGISRRKSFFGQTQREALAKLREARQQQAQGIAPTDDRLTYGRYLEGWLEHVAKHALKPTTHETYSRLIEKHISPGLGHWTLTKLQPQIVRKFLADKSDGLSSRTVQFVHAIVRKSLSDALKDGLVVRNVAQLVKPPRVRNAPVSPLTPDQMRTFLNFIQGDRLECLYVLAASLGLRQGELFGLTWSDVDLEAKTLSIRRALVRVKGKPHLDTPKTARSIRSVALPAMTAAALAAHKQRQQLEREFAGERWRDLEVSEGEAVTQPDFVFRTATGEPLESRNVTKAFQAHLAKCGLPRHRFHDLRHTAATGLLVMGVHPRAIQATLGWDQGSMIERYAHAVDEMRRDVADRMEALLNPVGVKVGVKTEKPAGGGSVTH